MNTVIKNKLISTLVVLLLLANMVAMSFFWWQHFNENSTDRIRNEGIGATAFLVDKLKFDSSQLVTFRGIVQLHQQKIKWSKDSLHLAKDAFFELLKKDPVSELELQESATLVGRQHEQLDLQTFHFFKSVQAICTPEQKILFNEVIGEALRIMGRPTPPRGRPNRSVERPEALERLPVEDAVSSEKQPVIQRGVKSTIDESQHLPRIEDRLNKTMYKISSELKLDAHQMDKVKECYAEFFTSMEYWHSKAVSLDGPPPMPSEEEKRARMELATKRDQKIEKLLTKEQFQKYSLLEKTLRPTQGPANMPN